MTGRRSQESLPEHGESRRQFFKLLAASPLLGLASSGLPANWQQALAHEAERGATAGPRRRRTAPSAERRCSRRWCSLASAPGRTPYCLPRTPRKTS